eukprot:scaffold89155_cov33-Tisochrysis_lutea.AAC.2
MGVALRPLSQPWPNPWRHPLLAGRSVRTTWDAPSKKETSPGNASPQPSSSTDPPRRIWSRQRRPPSEDGERSMWLSPDRRKQNFGRIGGAGLGSLTIQFVLDPAADVPQNGCSGCQMRHEGRQAQLAPATTSSGRRVPRARITRVATALFTPCLANHTQTRPRLLPIGPGIRVKQALCADAHDGPVSRVVRANCIWINDPLRTFRNMADWSMLGSACVLLSKLASRAISPAWLPVE